MKSKFVLFLILLPLFHVLLSGSISKVAFGSDASGSVAGDISCTNGSPSFQSNLSFSAFMNAAPVYGNWEITSDNGSISRTLYAAGYFNGGNLGDQVFDLEGTETSDDLCATQIPSAITINGICGPRGLYKSTLITAGRGNFEEILNVLDESKRIYLTRRQLQTTLHPYYLLDETLNLEDVHFCSFSQ